MPSPNSTFFGATVTLTLIFLHDALPISLSPLSGSSIAPGAFTETVTMTNTGTTTWANSVNGYTLHRNTRPTDPLKQGRNYYATLNETSVLPGSTGTFTLHLTAPVTANTY